MVILRSCDPDLKVLKRLEASSRSKEVLRRRVELRRWERDLANEDKDKGSSYTSEKSEGTTRATEDERDNRERPQKKRATRPILSASCFSVTLT